MNITLLSSGRFFCSNQVVSIFVETTKNINGFIISLVVITYKHINIYYAAANLATVTNTFFNPYVFQKDRILFKSSS